MINIAEILKDYPKGTKLYSPIFGEVYLDKIRPYLAIVVTTDKEQGNFKEEFLYDGKYGMNGECMLFPSKDQRDWNKFQRPFIDGDILTYTSNYTTTFIYRNKENEPNYSTSFYVGCNNAPTHNFLIYNKYTLIALNENCDVRHATEEEKQKLFDAIKENGYKWNEETKTLEKVLQPLHYKAIQPKFKVGDIVQSKTVDMIGTITLIDNDEHDYQVALKKGGIIYILFEFQDDWELAVEPKFKIGDKIKHKSQRCDICTVKDIQNNQYIFEEIWSTLPFDEQHHYELVSIKVEPKFKVGDVIQYIDTYKVKITAVNIEEECYEYESLIAKGIGSIMFSKQDEWELVPNKFDITTLKPFDKVLVRNTNKSRWCGQFYMSYDENEEYLFECTYDCWRQCIPYEGNEHLLGTTDDCNEFYKNW